MVIVLKEGTTEEQKDQLVSWCRDQGLKVHESDGEFKTILGLVGDVENIDSDMLAMLDIVDRVTRISEPYKNANRKFHPKDSVVELAPGIKTGGGNFAVVAGPVIADSREKLVELAKKLKKSGADVLMGAFGERSTVSTRARETGGVEQLIEAGKEAGMPVIAEMLGLDQMDALGDVDIIEVGQRNMQNYEMLTELGKSGKPVVLRRGIANTLEELLLSAERIMRAGNPNVVLCERGIRTFEQYTRDTFDIAAIPILHEKSHLPVIADPGSALGNSGLVGPVAKASAACGADGLVFEVAEDPKSAKTGGAESISPEEFAEIIGMVRMIRAGI